MTHMLNRSPRPFLVCLALLLGPCQDPVLSQGAEEHGSGSKGDDAAGQAPRHSGDQTGHSEHAGPVAPSHSIRGEVVDLTCYLQHPESGQGPDHAACARQCIMKGLPSGLKSADGTLYLLLATGHDDLRESVSKMAGKEVTLEGHVIESGGLKALVVKGTDHHPAPGHSDHRGGGAPSDPHHH